MKKIVIVGDVMIDETWYCGCRRLSPEAPIPVASLLSKTEVLGGAANVAKNLKALAPDDLDVYLCGWLGQKFQELLNKEEIHLWTGGWLPGRLTNIKLRIVDMSTGYHLVRVDNEEYIDSVGRFLPRDDIYEWIMEIEPDSIILSDYVKGSITPELAEYIIGNTHKDTEIFVDTRRPDVRAFRGADWITPNRHELQKILDFINIREPIYKQVPETVCRWAKIGGMLLTRGSEGMNLHVDGVTALHQDPTNKDIIDVTGAGDTALAAFAAVRTLGCKDHEIALKLANELAGEVCMSRGTTVPAKTLRERGLDYGHNEEKEE